MRTPVLLLLGATVLSSPLARAQSSSCEHPIANLASCPPCSPSTTTPLCRKAFKDYQPTVNGCGPEKFSNLIESGVIPQAYGDADFRNGGCPADQSCGCNQHDRCYGTCNQDKKACDDQFLQSLFKSCANAYPVDPRGKDDCSDGSCFSNNQRLGICRSRARLYYRAVAAAGQGAYDDAQKQACECCCNSPGAVRVSFASDLVGQQGPVCAPPRWEGTASEQADLDDGQGNTLHRHQTATVTWTQLPQDPTGNTFTASGSVVVSASGTAGPCTISLPATTFAISGTLQFFPGLTPPTYSADGEVSGASCLNYVYTCPDGSTTLCGDPKPWLVVVGASWTVGADTISGTSGNGGIRYNWSFGRDPPHSQ